MPIAPVLARVARWPDARAAADQHLVLGGYCRHVVDSHNAHRALWHKEPDHTAPRVVARRAHKQRLLRKRKRHNLAARAAVHRVKRAELVGVRERPVQVDVFRRSPSAERIEKNHAVGVAFAAASGGLDRAVLRGIRCVRTDGLFFTRRQAPVPAVPPGARGSASNARANDGGGQHRNIRGKIVEVTPHTDVLNEGECVLYIHEYIL